jgi:hypothetical protein
MSDETTRALVTQAELDSAEACILQAIVDLRAAIGRGLPGLAEGHASTTIAILEAARAEVEQTVRSYIASK